MRRSLLMLGVLAVAVTAGAVMYTAYANDREYARLIAAGDQAATLDQPFQALEAYSHAIALRPDSMLAHLRRGLTYRDRGAVDEAMRDLRRAAELDPTATQPLESLGDANLGVHRYERAAERYEAFLALDDRAPRVWYKLGFARYRAGQSRAALDPLRRAIALDRSLGEAYLLLGLALRDQGEIPAARSALETAAQLSPGRTAPREALAGVYDALNEPDLAVDQLEALAVLDAGRPDRFVALGLAYSRARRHEAAVLVLSRAVAKFPADAGVYGALGRVWLDAAQGPGDVVALKKAIEALTTAASHADVSSETLTDLGRAWLASGDRAAAERALRQAIVRMPVTPDAYRELASLAARDGRLAEARDSLIRYATLVGDTPSLASVATQIADYSIALGDPALALRWIERAEDQGGPTRSLDALRRRAAQ